VSFGQVYLLFMSLHLVDFIYWEGIHANSQVFCLIL